MRLKEYRIVLMGDNTYTIEHRVVWPFFYDVVTDADNRPLRFMSIEAAEAQIRYFYQRIADHQDYLDEQKRRKKRRIVGRWQ